MDGGWSGWWPSVVTLVLGLVVLGLISAFAVRRALRAEREFAGFRADVRAAIARLRSQAGGREPGQGNEMGRIRTEPTKGE